MRLGRLLEGISYTLTGGGDCLDRPVLGLAYDSRQVTAGFLFFAFGGAHVDGRAFTRQAFASGAVAVVSEQQPLDSSQVPWIQISHGRQTLALLSRRFYNAPDEDIHVIGITGTNGKTTTAFLIDQLLGGAGHKTGLVGTVQYRIGDRQWPALNTTPESLDLYRLLDELRAEGGTHFTMEASSHALALGRVDGLRFRSAVFTNLTRDHLDFHQTMENYFAAKGLLFSGNGAAAPDTAVINVDDEYGRRIALAPGTRLISYAIDRAATLRASSIESSFAGLRFDVDYAGTRVEVRSPLVGRINVYNLLAAFGAGLSCGLDPSVITAGLAKSQAVPGRFERIDEGQPYLVIVDYAHTDDALRNTIQVAREMAAGGRIITLFGCGGDRDRSKRPLMGQAAAELSDAVVITSDNPRSEDPLAILNDITVGLARFDTPRVLEPDRERAIRKAIELAQPGDIVLLAGKGHETYQVLKDGTIPFDDREVARKVLRGHGYKKHAP